LIGVLYDADRRTLHFWVNGKKVKTHFHDLPSVDYHAAVSLMFEGSWNNIASNFLQRRMCDDQL
jgi:hypothetical protein